MERLSYETLNRQGYEGYLLKDAPERILQFGEGNFMRAFAEDFVDRMNEKADFNGKVVLVQPRAPRSGHSLAQNLNEQEGLYTLYLRGFEKGEEINEKRVISCVSRCLNSYRDYEAYMKCAENESLRFITSNTTEAGIVYDPSCQFEDKPAASFPGKLTQFLYRRFELFQNQSQKGFIILPCELIAENGKVLKECVIKYAKQWDLGDDFLTWLEQENAFCSTLVDRIVTGYPGSEKEELEKENDYVDAAINTGEIFAAWVIEGPESLKEELPFEKAGLPILVTRDHKPYKERKVRILNGAHTSMVLGAYLAGQDIVRDCMEDSVICGFMNQAIYEEIIPTLSLPEEELKSFAASVTERFKNPFIDHTLLAISLNSASKWKARVMPSLLGYVEQFQKLPLCLTASFAFFLTFYRSSELTAAGLQASRPSGDTYTVSDDREVLEFFAAHSQEETDSYVHAVCTANTLWDMDLTSIPGFEEKVTEMMLTIEKEGTASLMKSLQND